MDVTGGARRKISDESSVEETWEEELDLVVYGRVQAWEDF